MKNITEFLYACIAEDERDADERMLAECEAKRRIIALHPVSRNYIEEGGILDARYIEGTWDIPMELFILAQPYSDLPGFDESWRIR